MFTIKRKTLFIFFGIVVATAIAVAGIRLAGEQQWVQECIVSMGIRQYFKASDKRRAFLNEAGLKVILCGTGSPQPNRERGGPCSAVVAGGRIFLVDVGGGGWRNMARWNMPADMIAGVLLTHFHSDHIQDLGEVNMQSWHSGRRGNLAIYGGPGVRRVVAGFMDAYTLDRQYRTALSGEDIMPTERYAMVPHTISRPDGAPLGEGETSIVFKEGGLTITAIGVNHLPVSPAYAYRFDYQGRSVVISGDTKASAALATAAHHCDVLVHEAQLQNLVSLYEREAARCGRNRHAHISRDIRRFHTSPLEAADIANRAGSKLLILTHLSPSLPRIIAGTFFLSRIRTVRTGDAMVGYDGLAVTMPPQTGEPHLTDLD